MIRYQFSECPDILIVMCIIVDKEIEILAVTMLQVKSAESSSTGKVKPKTQGSPPAKKFILEQI